MSFFKKLFSSSKKTYQEPKILLEEQSPLCPITAIVEQDNRVAYFYLISEVSHFGTKSCWIRNLVPGTKELDKDALKNNHAPILQAKSCNHPEGKKPLNKRDLSIVWTKEGDAAALLENGEIISIIPAWSGMGNFKGYAKDAIEESQFAWELKKENVYIERIREAETYWSKWSAETSLFQLYQPTILDTYEEYFGECSQYFAIDDNKFPPRGLYLRNGEKKSVLATVGMSLIPLPRIEMHFEKHELQNQIELGLIINSVFTSSQLQEISSQISGVAAIPHDNITFLAEGHTVNFIFPEKDKFTAVLLTKKLDILPEIQLGDAYETQVNLLWMVPITSKERKFIMENEDSNFIEMLNGIGENIFNLERENLV